MSVVKNVTREFKPLFLWTDQPQIKEKLAERNLEQIKVKAAVDAISEFDDSITEKEIISCLVSGRNYLEGLIRRGSPYPKADVQVLLKLQGRNADRAFNALQAVKRNRVEEFEIKDGKVTIKAETIESINKICSYYTRNQKQNDAAKYSIELSDMINKGIEKGFIHSENPLNSFPNQELVRPFNQILQYKKLSIGKLGLQPDPEKIIRLK
jgi:hypothetical protein